VALVEAERWGSAAVDAAVELVGKLEDHGEPVDALDVIAGTEPGVSGEVAPRLPQASEGSGDEGHLAMCEALKIGGGGDPCRVGPAVVVVDALPDIEQSRRVVEHLAHLRSHRRIGDAEDGSHHLDPPRGFPLIPG
jgi:hypothetical protein